MHFQLCLRPGLGRCASSLEGGVSASVSVHRSECRGLSRAYLVEEYKILYVVEKTVVGCRDVEMEGHPCVGCV